MTSFSSIIMYILESLKEDKSAKAFVINVVIVIAPAALGKAGESLAGTVCKTLGDWFSGIFDCIPNSAEDLQGTIYEELNIA